MVACGDERELQLEVGCGGSGAAWYCSTNSVKA